MLLELADQCVKCGYCLPVCPTFRLARTEAESPRGRIALIQGWLTQSIPPSPTLFRHLDRCLECRACEVACPSLVRYGALMDGARACYRARLPWWRRWPRQAALTFLGQPRALSLLAPLGGVARRLAQHKQVWSKLARKWPLVSPGPRLALLHRLAAMLHGPQRPRQAFSAPAASPQSTSTEAPLGLFLGCIARGTQGATIDAARRLLSHLGIPYREPSTQGCCGALLRHHGFAAAADRQLARNAEAFADMKALGFASACVLELQDSEAVRAHEICAFLIDSPALAQAAPRPLPARVLVHEPCSQRLLPGGASAVYRLLARIPALEVRPLPGNEHCCGAAGTYLLEHPRIALELLAPKLAAVRAQRPDYVVTTNSGCALHLAAGLVAAGLDIPVLHPIELLEQQLRPETDSQRQAHPTCR